MIKVFFEVKCDVNTGKSKFIETFLEILHFVGLIWLSFDSYNCHDIMERMHIW